MKYKGLLTFIALATQLPTLPEQPIPIKVENPSPRVVRGVGNKILPSIVSISQASTKASLEKALETLKERGLCYNVIIDLTSKRVYYFTDDTKTEMTESIAHLRSASVGVSFFNDNGHPQRDINSLALSIGVIGGKEQFDDSETYDFFVSTVQALCEKHDIPQHRVYSYSTLATEYDGTHGRVDSQSRRVPWKKMAQESGLGLWPKKEDELTENPCDSKKEYTILCSGLLYKNNRFTRVTGNSQDRTYQAALAQFKKDYHLEKANALEILSALNSLAKQLEEADPRTQDLEPPTVEKYTQRKRSIIAAGMVKLAEELNHPHPQN